jgi:intraflagellar transport protein 172
LKNNQSSVLYSSDTYVVSIATSPCGKFLISGHLNGVIHKFNFENSNLQKLVIHSSIPYCLAWGTDILAAGNDYKVVFYNDIGSHLQTFDYGHDEKLKEFTVARVSPSGDTIAIGNYNKFFVFLYNNRKLVWEEGCVKNIEGMYSCTSLCWKPDGSGLVTGNICGSVDVFEACLKKTIFKQKFEVTYVSHSQVIIKNIETNKRLVIKPNLSSEINKINIYLDNYIVMQTKESLILGDLDSEKYSELPWNFNSTEKYDFSNLNVCMIFSSGELTLIEYGNNEIMGYCRTEYIHSNLISVRLNYNNYIGVGKQQPIKIIAYLIDLNTIYIQDLIMQSLLTNLTHDSKIDFLELNKSGNKLIFRDRKRHLYLYYIFENKKITLLDFCGFVQWVPNSEVLVAQERKNVCVWYNVDDPDKVKVIPVKGEVDEIRRREGKTEVIVQEGNNTQTYLLDDGLIAFSTAIDENDLNKAVKILENLQMSTEIETHWKTLAKLAISSKNLIIAQRCYAAVGCYSKANYVKKVMKIAERDQGNSHENPLIEAKLLILDKQFNSAENLLLKNNLLDEAMEILNELHKWDESVRIAEKYNHPEIQGIKSQYFSWLVKNDQLDRAAELKEKEGDFNTAISLYIKGGYPAKAANLVKNYDVTKFDAPTLENIVKNLVKVGVYEKAGELLEIMGHYQRSLESYQQSKCYSKAVEIAKKYIPNRVERLEEEWGDYLCDQKQIESAIIHYIEAGSKEKSIEAAIQARKWEKAIELTNNCPADISRPFLNDIGNHFELQRKLDLAEKYYLKAQEPVNVFNMYVKVGKWEKAEMIIKKYMKDEDFSKVIVKEAMKYEQEGKYKEAEKLYIIAGEPDIAISMYKNLKQYDNMIRLVSQYRQDFLKNTHLMVAQYLEADKNLKSAEKHYIESGNWKSACQMYSSHNMSEESLRVAKANGSKNEINELAKKWVANLSKDQAIKMLLSMSLGEAAIDILCDSKDFEDAFKLAEQYERYKIPYVHLKYAMELEDEKDFLRAEEHYIKSNQVQEVIQMYEHIHDYQSALRIARQHDPASVISIYMNQGKYFLDRKEYSKAEICFVSAKQPEYMVRVYQQEKNLQEALKFASKHTPHLVDDIQKQKIFEIPNDKKMSGPEMVENARLYEDSKEYIRAIDTYLDINEKHFEDMERLEEFWNRAVYLAMEHDKNRAKDVVMNVAMKFKKFGKFSDAANLFENIGNIDDAVSCYVACKKWDNATKIVQSLRNGDQKAKLTAMVERSMKLDLENKDDPEEMLKKFKDERGLEMLIEKIEYDKCMSYAQEMSPEIFNKYLIKIVKRFLEDKNLSGAVEFLEKYNTPIYKRNMDLYKELALEILAEENIPELKSLKSMLYCLNNQLVNYDEFAADYKFLTRLHKVASYQFVKFTIKSKSEKFKETYYRVCMAVLAFCDIIKTDVALYDAGNVCKEHNYKGNAFILLNRYLDFYDVIDDPSTKLEEENEFKVFKHININININTEF